jgi:filamentous hemagglutinin family protein
MTNLDQFKRAPQGSFNLQRKLLAATVAACFGVAQANPTLPQVVAGQAAFAQQGNVFSITNTPNTIINWQSFSVGRDEITRFIQQSSDSKVLNRITGQDPSQILGSLQSNGQVFLINPNGVLFGKDARIDVHGLVASSLQLSNADFLAGKQNFNGSATAGKVVNQGSITTPQGGKVFLIAPTVENHGVISAPNGEILLAAGKSVQLVDSANPAITVLVSAPEDEALNLGQIVAQGGRVGIYGALVNQRGVVNANSAVRGENGKIILKASRNTVLAAGSVTTATGAGKGGEIEVLGQNVALNGDARVDASGQQGGGSVLLGGDYQGKNSAVQNARQTFIGKNAVIRADAEVSGDGGKVIVWADEATRAYGAISARSAGGKGGFIETSGHYLDVAGLRVDTTGRDATGVWLLDPYNIEVVSAFASYGTTQGVLADVDAFEDGAASGITEILVSTINGATADVVLQAKNNITFKSAVDMASEGKKLSAYAGNNIYVNNDLKTKNGAIGLYANYAGSGSASGSGAVTLASGKEIASGAANITLSGNTVNVNGNIEATPGGTRVLGNAPVISLRADNVSITGSITNDAGDGGYVSIAPLTSGRNLRVDDSVDSGSVVLTSAMMERVHSHELSLGGANTNAISVNGNFTMDANLVLDAAASITHSGAINADGHDVYFHVYDETGVINGNYGTISNADMLRLSTNNLNYSGVANSLQANSVYVDKVSTSGALANIYLGGTNPAGAYLSESELKMFNAPLIKIGTAAGYAGAIQISENLDLSGSNAAGTATGELTLKGSSVFVSGSLKAAAGIKIDATDSVSQGGGAISATRLTVSAPTATISLSQAGNQIGTVNLDGKSVTYNANVDTVVEALKQRSSTAGDGARIAISEGHSLTVQNADVQNELVLNTSGLTVANGATVKAKSMLLLADQMAINGSGSVQGTEYVIVSGKQGMTVGGTATAVEGGGMLLNSATLAKFSTPGLFLESGEGTDIHVWDTTLANTTLGLGAKGTLYVHGDVKAKGASLRARNFNLAADSSVDVGANMLMLDNVDEEGSFNVSATAVAGTPSITGADFSKFVAGTVQINGGDGVNISDAINMTTGSLVITGGNTSVSAAVNVAGSLNIISPALNVTAPVTAGNIYLVLDNLDLSGAAAAMTSTGSLTINANSSARVGGTLNSAEGGMALTSDELNALNASSIFINANGYGGDITLDNLNRANTELHFRAADQISNVGAVAAKNLFLSASGFDLSGSGTSLTANSGTGMVYIDSSRTNAILQINGSSSSNAVFNSSALANISAGVVQFHGNKGVVVAGAVTQPGGNLTFLSGDGMVDFQSAVDVGTGRIAVQSKEIGINNTLTAKSFSLSPLTSSNQYKQMIVGGSCASTDTCLSVNNLANVNAGEVVLGAQSNTSTLTVANLSSSAHHAGTTAFTLRAKDGINQTGAIDVNTLWVGTNGNTVLNNAGNRVVKLGADTNGGMTTQNLTFRNSDSLIYEGGRVSGTIDLNVAGDLTSGSYTLVADKLLARVSGSVGGEGALATQVKKLDVETTAATGKSSITINNNNEAEPGALTIERLVVANTNTGGITLSNYGATTIAATTDSAGNVRTGSGAISIAAHSPLTVNGKVASQTGAVTLEAGASATPSSDVLNLSSAARVQSGGAVLLKGGSAVNYTLAQVSGSTVTKMVNGVIAPPPVNPPPVSPPPVNPPPVNPPPVNPPPVNPPPVNPPPVNPPPVNPPPVNPPPVDPPPVNPPPVNPPPVNPPPVNPPPSADICTIAPNSALCQVLSPPTASEPAKPVQRAVTEVIKVINTSQPDSAPGSSGGSGTTGKSSASGPVKADPAKDEKKDEKPEEKKSDSSDKSANKEQANEKPPAKTFCN